MRIYLSSEDMIPAETPRRSRRFWIPSRTLLEIQEVCVCVPFC